MILDKACPKHPVEGKKFVLHSQFKPAGDQPEAIRQLIEGCMMAWLAPDLARRDRFRQDFHRREHHRGGTTPTLILAPNKTLAAQLYGEMKEFFPENAVEYFVSYYDYYQPEAYVPSSDTYIQKDASLNEHIEQMRLSATKALIERPTPSLSLPCPPFMALANRHPTSAWCCIWSGAI